MDNIYKIKKYIIKKKKQIIKTKMSRQFHPYHLVEPSPYPYMAAFAALGLTTGGVMYFHSFDNGGTLLSISALLLIIIAASWWKDIVREATYEGHHTIIVQKGLRLGMLLFIVSEILFFFAFFWGFFHSSLGPDISIGAVWPPLGIQPIEPFGVPLLNTAILLTSGATVTWSHHAMIAGDRYNTIISLFLTVFLAAIFTFLQGLEYYEASFSIADSVYGSVFFMLTGFHGFHVLIGTIFLFVCLIRIIRNHYTKNHHNGFEAGIWYWHFVDFVWLGLFVIVYWWGS